jgi:hypothetical protein
MSTGQSKNASPTYKLPVAVFGADQVGMADAHYNALLNSLDPDTLEAIADEIGGEFKHSARADSLRVIARKQRAAINAAEEA